MSNRANFDDADDDDCPQICFTANANLNSKMNSYRLGLRVLQQSFDLGSQYYYRFSGCFLKVKLGY